MDFDDLEEEVERRVAQGDRSVAGLARENRQPLRGTELPLVERSPMIPSDQHLPETAQRYLPPLNGDPVVERSPKLRLLCCYGAGDNIAADWALWQHQAPPNVEMITFEWPGHGIRKEEPFAVGLDVLTDAAFDAFQEAMDTGTFAVLGHSIGTVVMTGVCKRARQELNVEPVFAFMLERGPPDMSSLNQLGIDMRVSDPVKFMYSWVGPVIANVAKQDTEQGIYVRNMWTSDMLSDACKREVGWYTFRCPIYAFCAETSWVKCDDMPEEGREFMEMRMNVRSVSPPRTNRPGEFLTGHYSPEEMELWSRWTDHPQGARVVFCPGSNHFSVKVNEVMRKVLWEKLRDIIDRF